MSATNLDLPVLISPEQIRRREFVTIRRGYDPDQVRDYMEQLADQVELMQSLLREARQEAQAAVRANERPRIDPYDELARRVSGVIREADSAAEQIRGGAREDAERMTTEARTDADRIRTDAQARAEETRASAEVAVVEARAEADRTIGGLATRRAAFVEQLAAMQERLIAVAHDLERTIEMDGPEMPPAGTDVAVAPADTPGESSPASEVVIDVTGGAESPARSSGAPTQVPSQPSAAETDDEGSPPGSSGAAIARAEALFEELDDPDYEELWEGTQAMRIEMPEIPPLDLDWGDGEDDLDDPRD
jgi:DivIVA domain-containing protein